MNYILTVDAGTTASKISLFKENGELAAISTQEYSLVTPTSFSVEIEAETLWNAYRQGVFEVLKKSKINKDEIKAIGISAQGETFIPIDANGKPLRNAIVWLDNRAQEEADILSKEFDEGGTSFKITGQVKIVPTWPASKILWIKRNEPDVFRKTSKYLLVEDYLIYRMTGKYVAEGSLLCSTMYWNINTRKWWDEMLERLEITPDQLPEIRESGEAVGELLTSTASELGLSSRTIVSTGALDQAAGATGVGNIHPGIFSENTGAALAICAPLDKPIFDPKGRMPLHYFVRPASYMAHTFTTGGMVLRWFRDNFCPQEMNVGAATGVDPYDLLGKEAEKVAPGCEGLLMLPHLQGAMAPEANPRAKGVFYGFTLRHTKPHFARAIMESVIFIVRRNMEALEDMGIHVSEIRSLGGGARSRIWKQIEADITQKSVYTMKNEEAACLGAAILAGNAVGMYRSIDEACEKMITVKERFDPNPMNFNTYERIYQNYVQLYNNLCPMFERE
ncbi:MAG: FGGY-family carbohydrate kinase [Candidatus Bathyarchaeia archaeon]